MNQKKALVAFFLSFIFGIGHLFVGNVVRGVFYFLGIFFMFFLAVINSGETDVFLGFLFVAFMIWLINMIDMVTSLLRKQERENTVLGEDSNAGNSSSGGGVGKSDNERFYVLILSIIPGVGHFYIGFMHRGLSFLLAFFGLGTMSIFLAIVMEEGGFLAFIGVLPIIWIYNMFDVARLFGRLRQGEEVVDHTFLEDFTHEQGNRKSKAITILLSVFPGAGHLYLGLQKRGLQLMAGFLIALYVLDVLRLSLFLFLIPIIWFYSFFDALQLASRVEEEELEDVPLVRYFVNYQKWFGIALLVLGLYYLFDHVMMPTVIAELEQRFEIPLRSYYYEYFQTTVLCIVLIGGGIKLLAGNKKKGDRK